MGSRLTLGTAQFGKWYGIANEKGKVPDAEVFDILKLAYDNNLALDTAMDYGNAEELIGNSGLKFSITTKIQLEQNTDIEKEVNNSLIRLKADKLSAILIHNPESIFNLECKKNLDILFKLKSSKFVDMIGISMNSINILPEILDKCEIDIVQLPSNILNQQIFTSGLLDLIRSRNISLQIRSIFLQGLLLMDSEKLPDEFEILRPELLNLKKIAYENNTTIQKIALGYAKFLNPNNIIVGVDSLYQFKQIIDSYMEDCPNIDFKQFASEKEILNPAKWTIGGWRK